jgi:hypothetical protein
VVQGLDWIVSPTPAIQWERAKMSPSNGSDNKRIGNKERTSPCHTSVLNLGNTPRLIGFESTDDDKDNEDASTLPEQDPRKFLPSQAQVMALLKRAVIPRGGTILFGDSRQRWKREGRKTTSQYAGHLQDG